MDIRRVTIEDSNSVVKALMTDKEVYANLKPSEKVEVDKAMKMVCTAFLETEWYKKGKTSSQIYKTCCEIGNYCSFMNQPLFLILAVGAGLLFLNLISVGLISFFLYKRNKKSGGGSVARPTKAGKSTELF